jgi:hypothetical protein
MWRQICLTALAVAWVGSATTAVADDANSLNLPTAITPESLAKTSARGTASATADAGVEDGDVHASAGATASIDDSLTINAPITTGSISGIDSGSASQISTGIGNIQQGVSATAISF